MATSMNVGKEDTLRKYIANYQSDNLTFGKLFYKEAYKTDLHNLIVNGQGILDRYYRELDQFKVSVDLGPSDYRKYRFNPKLLSYNLYGTTELWFLILHANEISSVSEFDLQKIYFYNINILNFLATARDMEMKYYNYAEELKDKVLVSE